MRYLLFLLIIVVTLRGISQVSDNEKWVKDHYYKMERMIPMRDGIKLFTAIYLPRDSSQKSPVIFLRTPYSCSPYGEDKFNSSLSTPYFFKYLQNGYIIAFQDVRGKYMSEGEYMDVRPFITDKKTNKDIDEASDTYDAIDWMVKNLPANNGNVGVKGISYPGFYATMAALSNHPALKVVSPQAPVTDWFMGDDFHHNGAFFLMDAFSFYSSFGLPRPAPTTKGKQGYKIHSQDNYDFYLRTGALKNFTKIMGDSIKFWGDVMSHPNYDAWWKARNPRNFADIIKPATLIVGGEFDAEDCFGAWNLYKAIESKAKNNNLIVEGPWFHGGWARGWGDYLGNVRFGQKASVYYQDSVEFPFFNYYLKNEGKLNLSEATVFFTGENNWKHLDKWPPADMSSSAIYLREGGKLSKTPGISPANGYDEYISDPSHPVPYTEDVHLGRTREYMTDDQRFASRRTDVLTYQSEVLPSDLTLAGPVIADLNVSISTTDADFVVKIIDVFPDEFSYDTTLYGKAEKTYPMGGYQMLVRGEIMRGKFRNSFEKPEPFVPGKPTRVKFTLPDVAHTFQRGHKLMIQIQSSWFPIADRNPQKFIDIYHANDSDFQKATIKIYHDGSNGSRILLPVLK
jgi:uncharacterized protein